MHVALQCIAFEESGISETLDAWADQPVPSWANVSYEAWVTPSGSKQTCSTWKRAAAHDTFSAHEAPQYKLRARNTAHDSAVDRGYGVVMPVDADAHPLREDTLTNLLSAQREPSVASAVANPVSPGPVVGTYSNVKTYLREGVFRSIHGQCHTLSAEAWGRAGPFRGDIDHTELPDVWMEEEYRFAHRVRNAGEVKYVYDAPVHDDTRRLRCRWWRKVPGKNLSGYCDKPTGDETFAPRRRDRR